MLGTLATADMLTWLSIGTKALVYVTTLLAAGSVLSGISLKTLPESEGQILKRTAISCAVLAAVLSVLRLPLRASFLMGGTWQGAADPMLLTMVGDSPLGTSVALRLVGLALICAIVIRHWSGQSLAVLGACIVAASFIMRGHALEEPRLLLSVLITSHILGLAFWVGSFAPLYRLAGQPAGQGAGAVAHEFGRKAMGVVAALTVAGGVALWILTGDILGALYTPYGQFFAIKLVLFLAVLGFAAWNKMRLTPELQRNAAGAGVRLRQSILLESVFVAGVLLVTAVLTTLSAPDAGIQTSDVDKGVVAILL